MRRSFTRPIIPRCHQISWAFQSRHLKRKAATLPKPIPSAKRRRLSVTLPGADQTPGWVRTYQIPKRKLALGSKQQQIDLNNEHIKAKAALLKEMEGLRSRGKWKVSVGVLSKYSLDRTRDGENAILKEELKGMKHCDIPMDIFLQDVLNSGAEKARQLMVGREQCLDEYMDQVRSAADPDVLRGAFTDLIQAVLELRPSNTVKYCDPSGVEITGATGKTRRRPGGVLYHHSPSHPTNVPDWAHVLVPFEFKRIPSTRPPTPDFDDPPASLPSSNVALDVDIPDDDDDDVSTVQRTLLSSRRIGLNDPPPNDSAARDGTNSISSEGKSIILEERELLGSYALEMMSLFGDRRHVLGVYVEGSELEVWYFDRSGALGSSSIDVTIDQYTFVALILGLTHATRTQLGYEPVIVPSSSEQTEYRTDTKDHYIWIQHTPYIITNTLFKTRGLFGRGTVVFRVENCLDRSKVHAAKLSWQLIDKVRENDTVDRVKARLRAGPKEECLALPNIQYAADFAHLCSAVGIRRKLESGLPQDKPPENSDRVLRVILMNTLCRPLYEVRDIDCFKRAFMSILQCHHTIYESGHVLHGDISVDNLMVRCDKLDQGVLIDFDLAIDFADGIPQRALSEGFIGDRSGCTPFLSLDLLRPTTMPLRYRHDLESFFWALWWIATLFDNGKRTKHRHFEGWHLGTWSNMHGTKRAHLTNYAQYLSKTSPQFAGLRPWLRQLSKRFAQAWDELDACTRQSDDPGYLPPGYDFATMGGHIIYEGLVDDLVGDVNGMFANIGGVENP